MRNLQPLISLALAFTFSPLLIVDVHACSCVEHGTPPCAAYWRADTVFIGYVMEITPPSNEQGSSLPQATLKFAVGEHFRGVKENVIEVGTLSGTSCDSPFSKGEHYLVYAHRDPATGRLSIWPCDRTTALAHAEEDLAYIRSLSKSAPKQLVIGRVSEGQYEALEGMKITVEGGAKKYETVTDAKGNYKVDVLRPGPYKIRAMVPFSAEAVGHRPGFKSKPTEKQTIVEYEVEVPKGQCDYREMHLYKVDLKATATISGKVLDPEEQPVAELTVYLYSATEGQDFSKGDYQHARTDAEGNYVFEGLREGNYWLGVNIGRMPEVNSPYPTTFYPGVPWAEQAKTITLEQGQKSVGKNVRLPPKLIEREVTGVLLWPDGSPVKRMSPDAHPDVRPSLSVRDPQRLWYPLNPSRADRTQTVKIDEKGEFSIIVFEGYTYVLTAHAWNAENKPLHAKATKVTVIGDLKPLRLVLSLPGNGSEEEMKKELGEQ